MARRVIGLMIVAASIAGYSAQGLSVFHLGNSLTDETYGMHDIAAGFGYTGIKWGRFMVPGVPLHLVWSDSKKGMPDDWGFRRGLNSSEVYSFSGTPDQYLSKTAVDVLILQVYPANGDGADNPATIAGAVGFAGCAYQANPNCQVFIYASHTGKAGTKDPASVMSTTYEPIATAVRNAYPTRKPAYVIPSVLAFNKMVDEGYSDLWIADGHANNSGRYLLCALFYSVIYRSNCSGAIVSGFPNADVSGGITGITQSFATKAQNVAWSIAQSYAFSGVGATTAVQNVRPRAVLPRDNQPDLFSGMFDGQGKHVLIESGRDCADGMSFMSDHPVFLSKGLRR